MKIIITSALFAAVSTLAMNAQAASYPHPDESFAGWNAHVQATKNAPASVSKKSYPHPDESFAGWNQHVQNSKVHSAPQVARTMFPHPDESFSGWNKYLEQKGIQGS